MSENIKTQSNRNQNKKDKLELVTEQQNFHSDSAAIDPWNRYYVPLIAEFIASLLYTLLCKLFVIIFSHYSVLLNVFFY